MPYRGDQSAICWVPVDTVTKESGAMGYVRGSHKGPQYAPKNVVLNTQDMLKGQLPPGVDLMPDIEGREQDFDVVYLDAEPGDVLVHHVNTIHGSAGNVSSMHRRAASIRYIGDDVVFEAKKADFRLYAMDPVLLAQGVDDLGLAEKSQRITDEVARLGLDGAPLEGKMYPQVWPRLAPGQTAALPSSGQQEAPARSVRLPPAEDLPRKKVSAKL